MAVVFNGKVLAEKHDVARAVRDAHEAFARIVGAGHAGDGALQDLQVSALRKRAP